MTYRRVDSVVAEDHDSILTFSVLGLTGVMEPNSRNSDLANMKVECQHQSSTESVNTFCNVLLLSFFN
jgi:hypothetical protein